MAYFYLESNKLQALEKSIWSKNLFGVSAIKSVNHVSGLHFLNFGRTGEIRTRDQRIKSPLLYRLSYRPIFMAMNYYWPMRWLDYSLSEWIIV